MQRWCVALCDTGDPRIAVFFGVSESPSNGGLLPILKIKTLPVAQHALCIPQTSPAVPRATRRSGAHISASAILSGIPPAQRCGGSNTIALRAKVASGYGKAVKSAISSGQQQSGFCLWFRVCQCQSATSRAACPRTRPVRPACQTRTSGCRSRRQSTGGKPNPAVKSDRLPAALVSSLYALQHHHSFSVPGGLPLTYALEGTTVTAC